MDQDRKQREVKPATNYQDNISCSFRMAGEFYKGAYKGRVAGATKADPARAKKLRSEGKKLQETSLIMGVKVFSVKRYLTTVDKKQSKRAS